MTDKEITKSKPRRRGRRRKNDYFTKVHEQAIIDYCASPCYKHRSQLYESTIQPAFSEMVDKIIFTYKFNILPNIDSLRDDCKVWLTTILNKYDPNKGSKAFSYFSVVTKNWFIKAFNLENVRPLAYYWTLCIPWKLRALDDRLWRMSKSLHISTN